MSRPVWKGHISFGLVNVPVQLYAAKKRADLELHMLDSRNHARVRYERVNEATGEEVPWNAIVKGYEYRDGSYVVLEEADLKRAAPEATKTIEVESFVHLREISPLHFETPYYIEPVKAGEKGYALLHRVLRDAEVVGIARVVIRTRQYISAIMAVGNLLVLELLRYAQEIQPSEAIAAPSAASKKLAVSAPELKMARMLVDSMTTAWNPASYHDEYRDTLIKWIEKQAKEGGATPTAAEDEEVESTGPINFLEMLQKSLAASGAKSSKVKASTPKRTTKVAKKKATSSKRAG